MHDPFRRDGRVDLSLTSQQTRDAALLRATTELFIQEAAHERDEVRRYEELATHFLPKVAVDDRRFVAERLAPRIDAPLTIIRMLAKDAIEIAGPVIARSPVLGGLDLLMIIAATGSEHHRLIARRPNLSEEVDRALRIGGDSEVISILDTTASEKAEAAEAPQPASAPETPPPAEPARDWFVQRQPMRTRADRFDPWHFLRLERPDRLHLLADIAVRPPKRRSDPAPKRPDQAFRAILGAAQIVGFARSGQRDALTSNIAETLGLEPEFVSACLDDATGEPMAILLRSLNLDGVQAQQVFLLACPTVGRDVTAFFRLTDLYAGMETHVAETLIEAWRGDMDAAIPRHEPLFAENGQLRRTGVSEQGRERQQSPAADRANRAS